MLQNLWNPFRDWNGGDQASGGGGGGGGGFKTSETLLGIETSSLPLVSASLAGFKTSETLLGIETAISILFPTAIPASKPLKPF